MTIIDITPVTVVNGSTGEYDFQTVSFDLYRDIHKGIRAELFDITTAAGRIDPTERFDRLALASHVSAVAEMLDSHAHHEDSVIDPVLELHAPDLAERITRDHRVLEARMSAITDLANTAVDAVTVDQRRLTHLLYLELTGFTSAYLAHQIIEERVVMPVLEEAVGVAAVIDLHASIIGMIAPDVLAKSLAVMLPAMNVDNRVELLTGMRMSAPPEAFEAVTGLARSVLSPSDFDSLARRLANG